uniref:Uncharacterized protein n=1 Tax=Gadus morhua TaxID=8049 RepID=A0A8C5A9U5_GADMO
VDRQVSHPIISFWLSGMIGQVLLEAGDSHRYRICVLIRAVIRQLSCVSNMGLVVKVAGGVTALVSVYLLGYVTGYYVHKCL